jgi:hypothetical protein
MCFIRLRFRRVVYRPELGEILLHRGGNREHRLDETGDCDDEDNFAGEFCEFHGGDYLVVNVVTVRRKRFSHSKYQLVRYAAVRCF